MKAEMKSVTMNVKLLFISLLAATVSTGRSDDSVVAPIGNPDLQLEVVAIEEEFSVDVASIKVRKVDPSYPLRIVNYHAGNVHASEVNLPADLLYTLSGLIKKRELFKLSLLKTAPLIAVSDSGEKYPLSPGNDGNLILLVHDLAGSADLRLKVIPTEKWPDLLAVNKLDRFTTSFTNGLVSHLQGREVNSICFGDGSTLDTSVLLTGLYVNFEVVRGKQKELARLLRPKAPVVQKSSTRLQVAREFPLTSNGLNIVETVTVYPHQPYVDYQWSFQNTGKDNVAIQKLRLKGRYGAGLLNSRKPLRAAISHPRHTSRKVGEYLLGKWQVASMKRLGGALREPVALSVSDINGYGVGFISRHEGGGKTSFFPEFNSSDRVFEFGLFSETGHSNVTLKPNGKAKMRIRIALWQPGQDGLTHTRAIYRNLGDPTVPLQFDSGVAAFINQQSIQSSAVETLTEDLTSVNRLVARNGTLTKSGSAIRLIKTGDSFASLIWNPRLVVDDGAVIRVNLRGISEGAACGLRVSSASGEKAEARSKNGRLELRLAEHFTKSDTSQPFYITLGLNGPSGAYVDLEQVTIGRVSAEQPSLNSPVDGMNLTDFATTFDWKGPGEFSRFELQVASDSSFTKESTAIHRGVSTNTEVIEGAGPDRKRFMKAAYEHGPGLPAGKWYWRVRGNHLGRLGEWSKVSSFSTNNDYSAAPLIRKIDNEHPKFIFHSRDPVIDRVFPAHLKPYVARRGAVPKTFTDENVDVIASGSLAQLEYLFQTEDHVIGVFFAERFHHFWGHGKNLNKAKVMRLRLEKTLKLCVKYGRYVFWSEGNYHNHNWALMGADPHWAPLLRKYKDYFIIGNKSNINWKGMACNSQVQGLWLDGMSSQLMCSMENWYWGFFGRDLDTLYGVKGFSPGEFKSQPIGLYVQQMLLSMSQGASAYCIGTVYLVGKPEKEPDLRGSLLFYKDGTPHPNFNRYILPFMEFVVRDHSIPSKEEVISRIPVAITIDNKSKPVWGENDGQHTNYGDHTALFEATFGFDKAPFKFQKMKVKPKTNASWYWEYIPNSSRYWFPILPNYTPTDAGLPQTAIRERAKVIPLSELQTQEAVHQKLDPYFPPVPGEAFVTHWNGHFAAMNSHENKDIDQLLEVVIANDNISRIGGKLHVHNYLFGSYDAEHLTLHVNTSQIERPSTLAFKAKREPKIEIAPGTIVIESSWDAAAGMFSIILDHRKNGAAELTLR